MEQHALSGQALVVRRWSTGQRTRTRRGAARWEHMKCTERACMWMFLMRTVALNSWHDMMRHCEHQRCVRTASAMRTRSQEQSVCGERESERSMR